MQVLEAEFVLVAVVQEPDSAGGPEGAPAQAALVRGVKTYHLHVQKVQQAAANAFVDAAALTHYGGVPYEALYSGVFLDEGALQSYISMYEAEVGPPYLEGVRVANEEVMAHRVVSSFTSGAFDHFFCLLSVLHGIPACCTDMPLRRRPMQR